jgi:hypothetical protein
MICITTLLASAFYMAGRDGFIYVFHMTDPDHYQLYAKVATALGGRTAGYFGKGSDGQTRFYLTVPAHGSQSAEVKSTPFIHRKRAQDQGTLARSIQWTVGPENEVDLGELLHWPVQKVTLHPNKGIETRMLTQATGIVFNRGLAFWAGSSAL